jgi:hypothetical protein
MTEFSLSEIESRSGVERTTNETPSEYLHRIGELVDLPAEDVDSIVVYYESQSFGKGEPSDKPDQVTVDEFLGAVDSLGEQRSDQQNSDDTETETSELRDPGVDWDENDTSGQADSRSGNQVSQSTDSDQQDSTERVTTDTDRQIGSGGSTAFVSTESMIGRMISSLSAFRIDDLLPFDRENYETIDYIWIASIVVLGSLIFLPGLGHHPLRTWDESIYANAARHMVQDGYWVVPHLHWFINNPDVQLQAFLEKPPLVFWLQGLAMSVFGVSRFAARLPVAVIAIVTGPLVYRFGSQLFNRRSGLAATAIVFTAPIVYSGTHGARTGNTDVPLLFFGTLFLYLSWLAFIESNRELLSWVGLMAGLAVMVKGFNAGIFVIAIAPIALYHYRTLLSREAVKMVGVTAVIALPWPLYAWFRYREEFIYEIFLSQFLGRATGARFGAQSDTLFVFMREPYFQEFPTQFNPWVFSSFQL